MNEWRAIGVTLIALLALGLINDKTQRVAIWVAVIISLTLVLKKWKG